jgi:hydroxyacylglutathione hydrolase
VLTGDTLFVNDVARPDLAVEKSEGARGIFRSLRAQLLTLPDHVEIWPGHLGGSMCGGPEMDMKISSTIGFEKAHSAKLAIDDEDGFVKAALAGLGPQPPNFHAIVDLNRGPLLTDGVELLPLAPRQVEHQRAGGALVVDVRTDQQFDDAHIPGAISIPMLYAGFGSRLAWLADREQDVVLIGRDDEDGRQAGRLAVAVGIRRLAGFLHGGMTSWRQEKRPVARIERLPIDELPGLDAQVLDVRERSEWDAGHLDGSVHTPWHDIGELPAGLDPERPIAVVCGSGQRAAVAASLVARAGARRVIHVVDGGVPRLLG